MSDMVYCKCGRNGSTWGSPVVTCTGLEDGFEYSVVKERHTERECYRYVYIPPAREPIGPQESK